MEEENASMLDASGLAIKELIVKALPSINSDKELKTYALKNVPKGKLASMECFRMYLAEQLDLTDGIDEVGYYLRGGEKVWLKCCQDMAEVVKHINKKGRGSIWCVEKAQEEDNEEFIVYKANKKV